MVKRMARLMSFATTRNLWTDQRRDDVDALIDAERHGIGRSVAGPCRTSCSRRLRALSTDGAGRCTCRQGGYWERKAKARDRCRLPDMADDPEQIADGNASTFSFALALRRRPRCPECPGITKGLCHNEGPFLCRLCDSSHRQTVKSLTVENLPSWTSKSFCVAHSQMRISAN